MLLSDEVYRGLEHDPAERLPAACDALRARDLAEHRLQGVRPAGAADRLAGVPRSRAARAHPRAQAVHDDLLERPERTARRARAQARRAPASSAAAASCSRTCRASRTSSTRRGELFEWVRPSAGPIGFPRVREATRRPAAGANRPPSSAGVLLLPGVVYEQPAAICASASARANLPLALERLDRYLG